MNATVSGGLIRILVSCRSRLSNTAKNKGQSPEANRQHTEAGYGLGFQEEAGWLRFEVRVR